MDRVNVPAIHHLNGSIEVSRCPVPPGRLVVIFHRGDGAPIQKKQESSQYQAEICGNMPLPISNNSPPQIRTVPRLQGEFDGTIPSLHKNRNTPSVLLPGCG